MRRYVSVTFCLLVASKICFAAQNDSCKFKPDSHEIVIELQGGSKSFEPACQPLRIRVKDRQNTKLVIKNVSPVEICTVSSKAPAPTTAVNPVESIISTVTGLKGFSLPSKSAKTYIQALNLDADKLNVVSPPTEQKTGLTKKQVEALAKEQKEALDRVSSLLRNISHLAGEVAEKQQKWQTIYKNDLEAISKYILSDYRGQLAPTFKAKAGLEKAYAHANVTVPASPPDPGKVDSDAAPSEIDYAEIQTDIDIIKTIQSRFTSRCSSPKEATDAPCNPDSVAALTTSADQASALLSILQDNFKVLQTAQAAVATSVAALDKIGTDFEARSTGKDPVIQLDRNTGTYMQTIVLPADNEATDTGTVTCSTDTTPAIPTTDALSYTILYQSVPLVSASAGLLTTFLQMNVYGITQEAQSTSGSNLTSTSAVTAIALTNSARASVFPMAYFNVRTGAPALKTWWGQPYNELVIAHHLSAGIGLNPNSGTTQVEFFAGDAISFSRVFIHAGAHFGRTRSLADGFNLGPVPTGFMGSSAPITWSYHPAFSIGLSVRVAPF